MRRPVPSRPFPSLPVPSLRLRAPGANGPGSRARAPFPHVLRWDEAGGRSVPDTRRLALPARVHAAAACSKKACFQSTREANAAREGNPLLGGIPDELRVQEQSKARTKFHFRGWNSSLLPSTAPSPPLPLIPPSPLELLPCQVTLTSMCDTTRTTNSIIRSTRILVLLSWLRNEHAVNERTRTYYLAQPRSTPVVPFIIPR